MSFLGLKEVEDDLGGGGVEVIELEYKIGGGIGSSAA